MNTLTLTAPVSADPCALAGMTPADLSTANETQATEGKTPLVFASMLGLCAQTEEPAARPGAKLPSLMAAPPEGEQSAAKSATLISALWSLSFHPSEAPVDGTEINAHAGATVSLAEVVPSTTEEAAPLDVPSEVLERGVSAAWVLPIAADAVAIATGAETTRKGQGTARATPKLVPDEQPPSLVEADVAAEVPTSVPHLANGAAKGVHLAPSHVGGAVQEKLAAPPPRHDHEVSGAPRLNAENKFLEVGNKLDAEPAAGGGTGLAKPRPSMSEHPTLPPDSAHLAATPALANSSGLAAAFQVERGSQPALRGVDGASSGAVRPVSDAASVVTEVVELTHEFRARERGSVEVNFQLKDHTELSVRLSYRAGEVHTHFRTDSDSLRAALGREWHGQAAVFAQDPRGFRVADPVFTTSGDLSQHTQERGGDSSGNGDAQRQQESLYSRNHDNPRAASSGAFSGHSAASSSPARVSPPRVPSDRLLHAFA